MQVAKIEKNGLARQESDMRRKCIEQELPCNGRKMHDRTRDVVVVLRMELLLAIVWRSGKRNGVVGDREAHGNCQMHQIGTDGLHERCLASFRESLDASCKSLAMIGPRSSWRCRQVSKH